ncbi:MAG: 2,3-oxidosqualene cyclase [Planctomycetaceae bacterium]|nr:2,3-oxidosqualene cyclase [Planctomycetaceae bacterium]
MSLLCSMLVLMFAGDCPPVPAQEKAPLPTSQQVRAAVERSLPFLLEGGEAWREGKTAGGQNGRICVTCHQIPFTIWSHNEAKMRGLTIDQKRLDDLTAWSLDWCATQKHPKTQTHTGGFLSTMQQLIMGRSASPPDRTALETYQLFGKVIGTMQKEEGSWKEGNQIKGKGTAREADEVDTMWIILGLSSLEKLDGLPRETLESSVKDRERGLQWLKTGQPGTRTDWLALRMLVEREYGAPEQTQEWLKQLLAQQNADGGWPLMKGEPSHPLVTGQCLYALSIAGETSDSPAIGRATKYLVETQEKDGSWKAVSRNNPAHTNVVTTYWGTGWATIGLIRTLPKKAG